MHKNLILAIFVLFQLVFVYYVIVMSVFFTPDNYTPPSDRLELVRQVSAKNCAVNSSDIDSNKLCEQITKANAFTSGAYKDFFGRASPYGISKIAIYRVKSGGIAIWDLGSWFSPVVWFEVRRSRMFFDSEFYYIPSLLSLKFQTIHFTLYGFNDVKLEFFGEEGLPFGAGHIGLIFANIGVSASFVRRFKLFSSDKK
jgi:hypothetical protein